MSPSGRQTLESTVSDFADVGELDWDHAIVMDGRPDADGRRRLKAIGYFRDGTAAVVFAILGSEAISIISFRPARDKERRRLPWPPEARP